MPGEPPEVFGDRVGISGRGRLRDAAAHAARLFFTGQTAQFEFNLLGAVYERAHNLIEPLGCNAGQAPAINLPHLADQVLHIARDVARNLAVTSQHLLELAEVANSLADRVPGSGWVEPANKGTVRVKLAAPSGSDFR